MKEDKLGNQGCNGCIDCHNSTRCNNCAFCLYCSDLVLEKFMVFNNPVKTRKKYDEIINKVRNQLGFYNHPKLLTKKDIDWLKRNVKQFNKKVLDKIIADSILPDKPKEAGE